MECGCAYARATSTSHTNVAHSRSPLKYKCNRSIYPRGTDDLTFVVDDGRTKINTSPNPSVYDLTEPYMTTHKTQVRRDTMATPAVSVRRRANDTQCDECDNFIWHRTAGRRYAFTRRAVERAERVMGTRRNIFNIQSTTATSIGRKRLPKRPRSRRSFCIN